MNAKEDRLAKNIADIGNEGVFALCADDYTQYGITYRQWLIGQALVNRPPAEAVCAADAVIAQLAREETE